MAPGALDAPRALDASCAIELKVARRYQLGEGQPYDDALAALDERIRMRLAPSGAAVHVSAVPSTAPGAYEVSYTLSRGGSRLGGRQLASKLATGDFPAASAVADLLLAEVSACLAEADETRTEPSDASDPPLASPDAARARATRDTAAAAEQHERARAARRELQQQLSALTSTSPERSPERRKGPSCAGPAASAASLLRVWRDKLGRALGAVGAAVRASPCAYRQAHIATRVEHARAIAAVDASADAVAAAATTPRASHAGGGGRAPSTVGSLKLDILSEQAARQLTERRVALIAARTAVIAAEEALLVSCAAAPPSIRESELEVLGAWQAMWRLEECVSGACGPSAADFDACRECVANAERRRLLADVRHLRQLVESKGGESDESAEAARVAAVAAVSEAGAALCTMSRAKAWMLPASNDAALEKMHARLGRYVDDLDGREKALIDLADAAEAARACARDRCAAHGWPLARDDSALVSELRRLVGALRARTAPLCAAVRSLHDGVVGGRREARERRQAGAEADAAAEALRAQLRRATAEERAAAAALRGARLAAEEASAESPSSPAAQRQDSGAP